MAKLLYLDLETTGVHFWRHGIHEIAGTIVIDGEVKEHFEFFVRPNEKAEITDESLEVSGVTKEEIQSYPEMKTVHAQLCAVLSKYVNKFDKKDKFILTGYNAKFDNDFLRGFFVQNGDDFYGSWFWSNPVDVMSLAGDYLIEERPNMINFKQMTVARQLGIEIDEKKLHKASYDISITMKIHDIVKTKKS